jgi:predicted aspartyl protease
MCIRLTVLSGQINEVPFSSDQVAVLDTGANGSALDETILRAAGIEVHRTVSNVKVGRAGRDDVSFVAVTVPGLIGGPYRVQVVWAPLQQAKRRYSALLGMDFIKEFDLHVDYKRNLVSLERN